MTPNNNEIITGLNQQGTMEGILNGMDALITVCDPETFKILFLNNAILDYFDIKDSSVGKLCYEVLQKRDAPCIGCPYQQLRDEPDVILHWEHREFVKGSILQKTARFIDWPGGKKAHLEYAIDITPLVLAEEKLEHRGRMLDVLNRASKIFLTQNEETFADTMAKGFTGIAGISNIDRMSVTYNAAKPDGLYATQIYRWTKEAGTTVAPLAELRDTPYAKNIPRWEGVLASNQCVNGPARLMPEADALARFGCVSVLAIPVFDKGIFWGFVLFEDRTKERTFNDDEVDILRSAAFMLINAITRHERDERIKTADKRTQDALAEAKAANSAKSEFLSRMSHEMRTPLNAVIGMTAIGKRADAKERKDYALDQIEEASAHLLGVINDILDMSKIEAGKLSLAPVEFNMEHMLQKVITVFSSRMNEKSQHFTVNIGGDVPRFVMGDDQRISQIIINLLSNATKFTPENGKIHLDIALLNKEDNDVRVCVKVTDSGIGISLEQQAALFQPFTQADGGITRAYGGTGLGLSIVKRLVELMDGKVWVESEPGKGARFIFTIKLQMAGNNPQSLPNPVIQRPIDDSGNEFAGKTLLLAEDVDINREIIISLLDGTGITIDGVKNGKDALTRMETNPGKYDIILMDMQMPVMDGLEATSRIRALPADWCKKIPIIAMTANVFKADVERCIAAGMNGHIGKPIDLADVINKLRKYLQADTRQNRPRT